MMRLLVPVLCNANIDIADNHWRHNNAPTDYGLVIHILYDVPIRQDRVICMSGLFPFSGVTAELEAGCRSIVGSHKELP